MSLADFYDFRTRLVRTLQNDLLGPASPDEVIADAPLDRYITGILYPQSAEPVNPSEDVDASEEDDELGLSDPPVALANVRYPSSMGLSFACDSRATQSLIVEVKAGRYEELSENLASDKGQPKRRRMETGPGWQRVDLGPLPTTIPIDREEKGEWTELPDGLRLYVRVRAANTDGIRAVTVVLVNSRAVSAGRKDADAFFQPQIVVRSGKGDATPFVQRETQQRLSSDKDLLSYRLLYRHARSFAVGHGCSATWEVEPNAEKASKIESSFTPQFDLRLADSNQSIRTRALEMRYLSESRRTDVVTELTDFGRGYERWIADRRRDVEHLPIDLHPVAMEHLNFCDEASKRLQNGIAMLARDDFVWRAFQLANRAMLKVRARAEWLRAGRPGPGPDEGEQHRWRPFQLAFLLLCLEGLGDSKSVDRDYADLLWFPTGGGKTEAYLGLIAFTVFLRRMKSATAGDGVTVLMRYTMRLLTIQQFERAASLICTAEVMRRDESLGDVPISIGLWIGQGATPNSLKDARSSLDKLRNGVVLSEKNPVQLHSCPWCGEALDHSNYWIGRNPERLIIGCRKEGCLYKEGLPVWVVDEDIYRERPTLVIGTADKFASLPWSEDVGRIFNIGGDPAKPPELIIQDELHLITGPLGTLAGLYETAVDILCTDQGIRPKVVASTATIRRAGQQSEALFDRKIRQFPPPGLDARDSYFAVETKPEERGTRLYLGLMAPGTSQTTLLVRTYAALLQNTQVLSAPDATKDPYWTLVGYFNSLRVLGGARMQVQDDVKDRIEFLAEGNGQPPRHIDERIELTSREPSGNIPGHLKHMAVERPSDSCLDVILATNMISVGVDVERLGLMVVMGQPQASSEYIQATSRVGRKLPGLVVVLFNAARSRDRSHYESFVTYHSALYRQVESTSVTPFSPRARDRALSAILIALARLLIPSLRSNPSAKTVASVEDGFKPLMEQIVDRVSRVSPGEVDAVKAELASILEEWKSRASSHPDLAFRDVAHPERALLIDVGQELTADGAFPTLRSLRDVDPASNLYLVR